MGVAWVNTCMQEMGRCEIILVGCSGCRTEIIVRSQALAWGT